MYFIIFYYEKKPFLGYRNKKFKKSKKWHFSKGVNLWFWSKNGHFSPFIFLGTLSQENVFYDILERKNAFLGYKNNMILIWGGLGKKSESQMGFEPTTLRDLVGWSNHLSYWRLYGEQGPICGSRLEPHHAATQPSNDKHTRSEELTNSIALSP